MSHLQTSTMKRMYPNGYPRELKTMTCGDVCYGGYNSMLGAKCIIDNPHQGRPHWGPDRDGRYHQWGISSSQSASSGLSLSLAPGS